MNGSLLPPKTISEDVYNTLVSAGIENDVKNIEKLQEWYEIDAQSEQLRYILKVKILDVVFNHQMTKKREYGCMMFTPSNVIVCLFKK